MLFKLQKGHPGDELTWTWLNALRSLARTNRISLGMNSGLEMVQNEANGTILRVAGQDSSGGQWAVTAGDIPANEYNSFGTCTNTGSLLKWNPGLGSVYPLFDDGTCWVADTSKPTIDDVLNFSTTTGGIPANTLVWIQQDIYGNWNITAVDCGN